MADWQKQRRERQARLDEANRYASGKLVSPENVKALLEAVIRSGDRVCIEGDNQKQADFLSEILASVDPARIHDLHIVQTGIVLQSHLDLFDRGIACKLDFSYSEPQGAALARALAAGRIELGAIHTYIELFARYFMDLTPHVALIAAISADREGDLYTGPNTEDTPTIVEATSFKSGIVVAQVNEVVEEVPRVDIPGDWVDFVVKADRPFFLEPLFTRDPAALTEGQILMAMLAIKGIYAEYGVKRLNHGIGYSTATIELLLPTYGERLGLKGKIRGGADGARYAAEAAAAFISADGVGASDWRVRAATVHEGFVARHLSPGGCADLLAMTLFVDALECGASWR